MKSLSRKENSYLIEQNKLLQEENFELKCNLDQVWQALKHLRHNAIASGADMGLAIDVANDALGEGYEVEE